MKSFMVSTADQILLVSLNEELRLWWGNLEE